jgi:predicted small secreted protein
MNKVFFIIPFILAAAAAILSYTSIIEIVPEFIEEKISHKK